MGWFLRKSFRIGPLRLNLSRRGLGASVGIKGARVGVDATGQPYAAGGRYGFYFRERLGTGRPREAANAPTGNSQDQPRSTGSPSWMILALVLATLALLVGFILGVVLARAGEPTRIDLFDTRGRRTGYAVVDRDTGRVDFYDAMSRRTGYGQVDDLGRAERFGPDGRRQGETALPAQPRNGRSR